MIDKEKNERIEKYLLNNMEDIEREAFEADLKANASLKELTERRKILINGIRSGFSTELKARLQRDDLRNKQLLRTRRIQFVSGIAAVIIIGLFSQVYLSRIKHDSSRIYSEYYKTYPNITSPISRSIENDDSPFYHYETASFEQALVGFNLKLNETPDNDTVLFYAGISSMELVKYNKAINYFKRVGDNDQGIFTRPAYWYLSLAYINLNNYEVAAEYLNNLVAGMIFMLQTRKKF